MLGAVLAPAADLYAQRAPSRSPANFIPDDQIEPLPLEQRLWIQEILVEDSAGVLESMRHNFENWHQKEEYVRRWKVEAVGPLSTPTAEQKKSYLMRQLLKYADKRLSGEIKNAEEGSTFHNIGQVEQALRPNAEAQISSKVSLKLRARVLQGKAILLVNNPWLDYNATIKMNGSVDMHVGKELKEFGVRTAIDYQVKDGIYVARIDKTITAEISARFSATQDIDKAPFKAESDSRIELTYNRGF
tara:strand:+ start:1744 stop:2478 length:735 start_codon:yes stop_codon:yes gene_type:complete